MARTPRIDPEGCWHHTMNRGGRHQPIFGDDFDRTNFLSLLAVVHERFGVETQAYCLMGNHYHLLLHCPKGNLSKAMHYIGTVYTQRFNRRYDFDGALFRGRFLSLPIATDQYLLDASRYIHRNPTGLNWAAPFWEYPWSSYGMYLGLRPKPAWLGQPMALTLMNNNTGRYREHVETARSQADVQALERAHDPEFRYRAALGAPTLETVEAAVASTARISLDGLRVSSNGRRRRERLAVLLLAVEVCDVPVDEVADRYGLSSRNSVWSAVRRARDQLSRDPVLGAIVSSARTRVTAKSNIRETA